jgi:hypothetical protein
LFRQPFGYNLLMTLTKHAIAWIRRGPIYGTGYVYQYRVGGLPLNEEAFLANFGNHYHESWKTLLVKDGVSGGWRGEHSSADETLASISD